MREKRGSALENEGIWESKIIIRVRNWRRVLEGEREWDREKREWVCEEENERKEEQGEEKSDIVQENYEDSECECGSEWDGSNGENVSL